MTNYFFERNLLDTGELDEDGNRVYDRPPRLPVIRMQEPLPESDSPCSTCGGSGSLRESGSGAGLPHGSAPSYPCPTCSTQRKRMRI